MPRFKVKVKFGSQGGTHKFNSSLNTFFELSGGSVDLPTDTTLYGDNNSSTSDFNLRGGSIGGIGKFIIDSTAQGDLSNSLYINTDFVNRGHVKHIGSTHIYSNSGGTATYLNEGILDLLVNNSYGFSSGIKLINTGILNIENPNSGNTTQFQNTVDQNGTLNLITGRVNFNASGNSSHGIFNLNAGTTLLLTGGSSNLSNATIQGEGLLSITSGTHTFNGQIESDLSLTGGTMVLAGDTTLVGNISSTDPNFILSSATINGPGKLILDSHVITEFSSYIYLNTTLVNQGYFTHLGTSSIYTQGTQALFLNEGILALDAGNASGFRQGVPLQNKGIIFKTNTNYYDFHDTVENEGIIFGDEGTINFKSNYTQTNGSLVLNGGNVNFTNDTTIASGTIEGQGTITGNLTIENGYFSPGKPNFRSIDIFPGEIIALEIDPSEFINQLSIVGDLSFGTNSIIQFEFLGDNLSLYDYASVSGSLSLNGTLSLVGDSGLWSALPPGGSLTLFDANSITGTFSNLISGDTVYVYDPELELPIARFSLAINANNIQITQFEPIPEPSTYAMFALGSIVIGIWWYRRKQKMV